MEQSKSKSTALTLKRLSPLWVLLLAWMIPLIGYASINKFDLLKANQLDVDNVRVDGNTISTTNTNGNLTVDLNGTGATIFTDLTASSALYLDSSKKLSSETNLGVPRGGTGAGTFTSHGVLVGQGTSAVAATAAGTAGQLLASGGAGADPSFTTPTYPIISGTAGKVLVSDGTNIGYSTPTFPNASATTGKIIISDGTNWIASTPTFPNSAATTGKILRANGTNYAATNALYPDTVSAGQIVYGSATNTLSTSYTPTLGASAGGTGKLNLSGTTSGTVTVQPQDAAGTYNFNLPTSAGSSGNYLKSGGGGSTAMSWGTIDDLLPSQSGNSGKLLTTDGSNASWTSPGAASTALSKTAQSTTYSAAVGDYVVMSGASWTVTLPTAVGNDGKFIALHHAGTSVTQAYTINTTSAQTVGGIASGAYVLRTNGEYLLLISDGSNWQIVSHKARSAPVTWTPTFSAGFGTTSSRNVYSWRDGRFLKVLGQFNCGTTAASAATMSIGFNGSDANVSIDTTYMGGGQQRVGVWASPVNNGGGHLLDLSGSSSTISFGQLFGGGASGTQTTNGTNICSSGNTVSVEFSVPISGWQD